MSARVIEKIIVCATVVLIGLAIGILFYFLALRLGGVARENQAYNRYNACVLSVPPRERDITKIDRCWDAAQKDTGIEVKRYDGND